MKQLVYTCGPMTGRPHFGFPEFHAAAQDLRSRVDELGNPRFDVVSPAELDSPAAKKAAEESLDGDPSHYAENDSWGDLLARDVKLISDGGVEAIVVLPGWKMSRGARLETFVGRLNGLPILRYPTLEPVSEREIDAAHASDLAREEAMQAIEADFDLACPTPTPTPTPTINYSLPPGFAPGEETRVVDSTTGGAKGVKSERYDLLPWAQLDEVARLYAAGAHKYDNNNWRRGYKWSLSYSSLIRHARAFWGGEAIDPEMKRHHLASVVFHALALMYFEEAYQEGDDRWLPGLITDSDPIDLGDLEHRLP